MVEDLIKVWESSPCLLDVQSKVYKDSNLKAAAWQEMGKVFDTTGKLSQQQLVCSKSVLAQCDAQSMLNLSTVVSTSHYDCVVLVFTVCREAQSLETV